MREVISVRSKPVYFRLKELGLSRRDVDPVGVVMRSLHRSLTGDVTSPVSNERRLYSQAMKLRDVLFYERAPWHVIIL